MKGYKGFFRPKNPSKYRGDPTNIVYRSRWESVLMSRLDTDSNVIWWSSEETIIPYRSPMDNRVHRYFPDFLARIKTKDGGTKTIMIEVKPYIQTIPPVLKENKSKKKRYMQEVMTYGVNQAKWKAATDYCRDRGYEFIIMTENELGLSV